MSSDRVTLQGAVALAPTASATSRPAHQVRTEDQALSKAVQPAQEAQRTSHAVEEAARRLEPYLRSVGRSIEFRVDSGSGRTVISVRDSDTGELIRQIPNEEVLHFAEMAEDQTLVLLNEKV